MSDHLELRAVREEDAARRRPHPPRGPDGVVRTRIEYGHRRLLATLFGTVIVRRCAWRAPGATNLHPVDVALSLPRLRHSHQLTRLAAIEATRGSFDAATAAILAGHARRVAETITTQADNAGLKGDRRRGADTCVRYLTGNAEFLRYDQALAAGWPIATGVIEGACRHLIADRLDISGARWGLDGAEAVLSLRALHSNGDFDVYWRYHVAREHERLYPPAGQGEYTLSA